jgi:hypothetical protein
MIATTSSIFEIHQMFIQRLLFFSQLDWYFPRPNTHYNNVISSRALERMRTPRPYLAM